MPRPSNTAGAVPLLAESLPSGPSAVALVNMPLFAVDRPALGISLLKADLERHGIPCANLYLNIPFAERIGLETCGELDLLPRDAAAGDWMFVEALWGADAERDSGYLDRMASQPLREDTGDYARREGDEIGALLSGCRREATRYIDDCLAGIPWERFRIVGFSSQCQQLISSLALARRIKERHPGIVIAFGGGNCRGGMGEALFRAFPLIDMVCLGEGEGALADFAAAVLAGREPGEIAGLLHRGSWDAPAAAMVADLDGLPDPDFADFFAQRDLYPNPGLSGLHMVVETSRGCWWGQTSQCAFCGLNVNALAHRRKSAPRAADEFGRLIARHGSRTRSLRAADTILPRGFPERLFPLLAEAGLDAEIFYYVRSDMTGEQMRLARAAGVREIQPGIESLSRTALKRMRKGVTPLQNIRLLKWCRQYGVFPIWYYLYGMPGEGPDEYREALPLLGAISHLTPPSRVSRVRIDRYSLLQTRPADFGLREVRPSPLYRFIYPGLAEDAVADLAYYFDADSDVDPAVAPLAAGLLEALAEWTRAAADSALFSLEEGDRLLVCDFRPGAAKAVHVLTGRARRAFEACDAVASRTELAALLGEEGLEASLAPLLEAKLLVREKDQYLALAVPLGDEYFPPESLWARLPELLEAL